MIVLGSNSYDYILPILFRRWLTPKQAEEVAPQLFKVVKV